jgi:hypothetical protein
MWFIPLIAAAAGAATGLLSTHHTKAQEDARIRRQQRLEQEAYGYETAYNNSMFSLQRGEALGALGIQRNRLAEAFGLDVAGFNLGLEGQALQAHSARASLADSAGQALAAQGASGTRGSGSLQRRIGFEEAQLARQIDLQGRGNSLAVQGMAAQYTNQFDDIGREIDSWGASGWRTRAKGLGDMYAAQTHGLRMKGYEYAISDIYDGQELDYLVAALGGAAQGAGFGSQLSGYLDVAGKTQGAQGAQSYGLYGGNALGMQYLQPGFGAQLGRGQGYQGLSTGYFYQGGQ